MQIGLWPVQRCKSERHTSGGGWRVAGVDRSMGRDAMTSHPSGRRMVADDRGRATSCPYPAFTIRRTRTPALGRDGSPNRPTTDRISGGLGEPALPRGNTVGTQCRTYPRHHYPILDTPYSILSVSPSGLASSLTSSSSSSPSARPPIWPTTVHIPPRRFRWRPSQAS